MDDITIDQDIRNAVETLRKGGIILYPTDTVWGIGCDATNAEAVEKIYRLKQRAESKSMLVLVDSEAMLERTVRDVPEVAWELLEAADEPLTVIYDSAPGLARNLVADDGSAGIRLTKDDFCRRLVFRLRRPLVSTSANISGHAAPAVYSEISEEIKAGVDYICHHRRDDNTHHAPSHIIKLGAGGLLKIIR